MIAVGGENLMDMIQSGTQNGNMLFEAVPGGSPYNVAMAIGRQGVDITYLTPISSDSNGDQLAAKLETSKVILSGGRVTQPTSLAMVTIDEGLPSYSFYREGTAERALSQDLLRSQITPSHLVLHIGSLALAGGEDAALWEELAHDCKARNMYVSLDPNVRPSLIADPASYRDRIHRLLAIADIVKLSDEDLLWLYEGMNEEEALIALRRATTAEILILTKGGDGSLCWHDGAFHHRPASAITKLQDAVGAGDTFMASLLVWLVKTQSLSSLSSLDLTQKQRLQDYAGFAAARNCEQQGCNPPWAADLPETASL